MGELIGKAEREKGCTLHRDARIAVYVTLSALSAGGEVD
jgi:hypothetical protein